MKAIQLKAIREKWGLTQTEFASLLDVTERQVRRWEKDDTEIPLVVEYAIKYLELTRK